MTSGMRMLPAALSAALLALVAACTRDGDTRQTVAQMQTEGRFRKMLILAEPCYSESIVAPLEGIPGVLAMSSAGTHEQSFSDNWSSACGGRTASPTTSSATSRPTRPRPIATSTSTAHSTPWARTSTSSTRPASATSTPRGRRSSSPDNEAGGQWGQGTGS